MGGRARRKINKMRKKQFGLPIQSLCDKLSNLKFMVENINQGADIALRDGTYKKLDPADVYTTSIDGWVFGYKLLDHADMPGFFTRRIFVKSPGYMIKKIPDTDKNPVLFSVFETFLEQGQGTPLIEQISTDCMMIEQTFQPLLLAKKSEHRNPKRVIH